MDSKKKEPNSVKFAVLLGCLFTLIASHLTERIPYCLFGKTIDSDFLDSLKWFSFFQPMILFIGIPVSLFAPFVIYWVRSKSKRVQMVTLILAVLLVAGLGAVISHGIKAVKDVQYTVEKHIVTGTQTSRNSHAHSRLDLIFENGDSAYVDRYVCDQFDEGDEAYVVTGGYGASGVFPVSEYSIGEGVSVS